MNEETFDRLRKLISEGDEMDVALGDSNGKSFETIANAIADECNLEVDDVTDTEALLSDEYVSVHLAYNKDYNEAFIKDINISFYNSDPSALMRATRTFNSLMEYAKTWITCHLRKQYMRNLLTFLRIS